MENTKELSRIKRVRLGLDLTQRQMAEKLGCGYTSLRRHEYQDTLPENKAVLSNLRALAALAQVSIEPSG